jgi:PBSX family phage terminase large subunit
MRILEGSTYRAFDLFSTYEPHPKQLAFHGSTARIKCCAAGTRGGKTFAGAREFVRKVYADRAAKHGRLFYWIVAPDYSLTDVAREELFDILGADLADPTTSPLVKHWNGSKLRLVLYGDIYIEFKSAERPEKLVARGLNGCWIDEASRCPAVTWANVRARIADRRGWALLTTTPMGKNWFYNEVYVLGLRGSADRDPDYESFHWTTADNTALPWLKDEMERARKVLPPRYFQRDWEASFEIFAGQIYDEFDRQLHVVERANLPLEFKTVIAGKDWGFADGHPGATVVLGLSGSGKWYVLEEVVETRRLLGWWTEKDRELMEKWNIQMFYADPSEPEHIYQYRVDGLPIMEAKNRVAPGIQTVATLLHPVDGVPSLYFAEDCHESIEEIEGYHYKEDRFGNTKEEPEKSNDHTCDAIRYALHTHVTTFEPERLVMDVWG